MKQYLFMNIHNYMWKVNNNNNNQFRIVFTFVKRSDFIEKKWGVLKHTKLIILD